MDKNSKSVLFVVLNLNGWKESLTCVDAILEQTYQDFHLMLIDNGSKDESIEKLAHFEKNEKIIFIKQPVNLGFAGGVNIGIKYALQHNYEYIVLLNNDARITKKWLETLIQISRKTKASIVTGLLLSGDGKKIESTGDSYSKWGLPFPRQRDEEVAKALESGYVFGGTAGASLYKTSLFEDIGFFDERFFAYFEDTDISLRAQLAGHRAYYEKLAIAYHDHGTTSSKMPGFTVYQTFKNLPLFFWKNVPSGMLLTIGGRFIVYYLLIYVRAILRRQFTVATKGLLTSLRLLPHAFYSRIGIQKKRRVSSTYLQSIIYAGLPPNNRRYARRIFRR